MLVLGMDKAQYQDLIVQQQEQIRWLQSKFCMTMAQTSDDNRFITMFNRVIELIPGYIAWKDDEGKYLGCNKEQADYLGLLSPDEIVGMTDADLQWYEPKEILTNIDRKVLESQLAITREVDVITPHGERLCFLSQYAPLWIEEHEVKAMILISFDITPQKNMMRALERENSRAEAANLAKDQFITQMCHDIRTPFCGLISMVEQLAVTEKDNGRRQDLELINSSANNLLALLNQIIDSAKVAESNMEIMPCSFSLPHMVQQIESLLRPSITSKGLFLTVNYDPVLQNMIVAPENAINRVLLNLLTNAIKYTERGGLTVNCKVNTSPDENLYLEVEVIDTGIGIPATKLEYIFGRFNQINAATENNGIGMGLHMVKVMVEKMHGSIHVSSTLGEGSCFRFIVPLALQPGSHNVLQGEAVVMQQTPELCYRNILLVEDSMIAQRAAELIIDRLGANLTIAACANEAMQQDLADFDLILIDVGLPDISGDRFAHLLREEYKITTKIVILTAQHDFASRSIYGKEIDAYVEKPLTYKGATELLCNPLNEKSATASTSH